MDFRPLSSLLSDGPKIALIILNQPLDKAVLNGLWSKSLFTAVTDGATNRLHELAVQGETQCVPNLISGDFDSATPAALDYFREKDGVEIVSTPDQDYTDFTKSLKLVLSKLEKLPDVDHIVALGAFGGRFDHCMANIDTLYTATTLTHKPLVLMGEGNVACLLQEGRSHTLRMTTGLESQWCGLVPVGKPAGSVYTTGLKYNLNGEGMEFGGLISTSNSLTDADAVTVKSDQPLVWMQGYKDL